VKGNRFVPYQDEPCVTII